MESELHKRLVERSEPLSFRITMGLFGATTLGVGALMGAGLYVLVGLAAAETGPGVWLAYLACGLITFLTVLVYARLARRMPVSGGGYVYAYRQLGSFWGFIVGWHLALGSIFACALYATGFAAYVGSFSTALSERGWALDILASAVTVALTLLAALAGQVGERLQKALTWGNVLVLLALAGAALLVASPDRLTPVLPEGVAGIGGAISVIYISFFGYQLIANNAEEIRDAPRTVPRAMALCLGIAILVYVVVAISAVAAVPWKELAATDAPLSLVARRSMGHAGLFVVGAGGILASAAALNSTLVSQARQIFAMGRDHLLPGWTGSLTRKSRIPVAALGLGGAVTVLVIALADAGFIARAANFSLLVSMLPVSLALWRLQRELRASGERIAWYLRLLPWLALVANAGILLTLDLASLAFGAGLVVAGCLVFLGYSYVSEKRGRAEMSIRLDDSDDPPGILRGGERVLIPVANPATQASLMSIAQSLLTPSGGEVIALSVVRKEREKSPREALRDIAPDHDAMRVLERTTTVDIAPGILLRPVIRAATNLAEGIAHAADEEGARLVVMGWAAGAQGSPSALLEDVASRVASDVVFLQSRSDEPPAHIGVCFGGRGGHLGLMVRVATALAQKNGGDVSYLTVVPEAPEGSHMHDARHNQIEAIQRHAAPVPLKAEIIRAGDALEAIVERSRDLDALVVGSFRTSALARAQIGSFASEVARRAHCSVIVVRQTPALRRLVRAPAIIDSLASNGGGPQ